ncbi:MAG: hypothetical protein ABII22_01710 [Candidatus Micrarchaeota archaeon]
MGEPPTTYDLVNNSWKSTTNIIFGETPGEMKEYDAYLREPLVGKSVESFLSGKDVFVTSMQYDPKSRFFDYEADMKSAESILSKPIDINKIKDIDSLFEAVQEKIIYSGNKILGNSHYVENSDSVTDSNYVFNSSMVFSAKYIAYSYMMRKTEYGFASTCTGDSTMTIRCFYNNAIRRCFECITVASASDCFFCHNLLDSADCMFTFNKRATRNMIGNIQLTKEQYVKLKIKLVGEIVEDLKVKKRAMSLLNLMTK